MLLLLKQWCTVGAGNGGDSGLGMVDIIMRQLLSKEVLYGPLKVTVLYT